MVNLQFECLLVRKQLGVVRLKLNIFIQGLRVFLRQEVDGFLKLGQDINFTLLSGDEPGHDRPDRATREQKHEQILQYLEIHIKVQSNLSLATAGHYTVPSPVSLPPSAAFWVSVFLNTGTFLLSRTTNSSPKAMLVSAFMSILKK